MFIVVLKVDVRGDKRASTVALGMALHNIAIQNNLWR